MERISTERTDVEKRHAEDLEKSEREISSHRERVESLERTIAQKEKELDKSRIGIENLRYQLAERASQGKPSVTNSTPAGSRGRGILLPFVGYGLVAILAAGGLAAFMLLKEHSFSSFSFPFVTASSGSSVLADLPNATANPALPPASGASGASGASVETATTDETAPAATEDLPAVPNKPLAGVEFSNPAANEDLPVVPDELPASVASSNPTTAASPTFATGSNRDEEIRFGNGRVGVRIPGDFKYSIENGGELLIMPKNAGSDGIAWLRVKLQQSVDERSEWEEEGKTLVKDMARSQGQALRTTGGKIYYWRNDTFDDGRRTYEVRSRIVGFENSIVLVASGTVKGKEYDPAALHISEAVPAIIASLKEF